ncbi:hypothetical protein LZ30DRAFT_219340 [Colletotrichum cereale]|nr:hypothetical protein LZ30DRAFT_219340 [Colletotrichum cereale]
MALGMSVPAVGGRQVPSARGELCEPRPQRQAGLRLSFQKRDAGLSAPSLRPSVCPPEDHHEAASASKSCVRSTCRFGRPEVTTTTHTGRRGVGARFSDSIRLVGWVGSLGGRQTGARVRRQARQAIELIGMWATELTRWQGMPNAFFGLKLKVVSSSAVGYTGYVGVLCRGAKRDVQRTTAARTTCSPKKKGSWLGLGGHWVRGSWDSGLGSLLRVWVVIWYTRTE